MRQFTLFWNGPNAAIFSITSKRRVRNVVCYVNAYNNSIIAFDNAQSINNNYNNFDNFFVSEIICITLHLLITMRYKLKYNIYIDNLSEDEAKHFFKEMVIAVRDLHLNKVVHRYVRVIVYGSY